MQKNLHISKKSSIFAARMVKKTILFCAYGRDGGTYYRTESPGNRAL